MSKVMRPTSMRGLLERIAGEWRAKGQIFDLPEAAIRGSFALEARSSGTLVMGSEVRIPVGPAAGPHTQIAEGLVAAYLCGARVFELKTVQALDRLDIEKPCIDTLDEGYNVEWSTELSLEEALAEYLKAWAAIHLMAGAFSDRPSGALLFNMSVGYTLEGIRSKRVDGFIDSLTHPEGSEAWAAVIADAREALAGPHLGDAFGREAVSRMRRQLDAISLRPVHSVTLSTMHGCPPEEIEGIARHLIVEKGLSTYVKLNPTLLGYERVRSILDETGWRGIDIERESFDRDLKLDEALALCASLTAAARQVGRSFGLKLSNTLACRNGKGRLPGAEAYLSGRALFPITTRLAAELAKALPEPVPFSFSGGVTAMNAADCMRAGLAPLTLATELVKPGGYLRLAEIAASAVEAMAAPHPALPDGAALDALAISALGRPEHRADWKQGRARVGGALPLFDCFRAPCVEACPAGQQVPVYIRALAAGNAGEAFRCVIEDNPLPTVTGLICDHACTTVCARNDYEGPVDIRGLKLASVRIGEPASGPRDLRSATPRPGAARSGASGRTAIFGAGPAGLSCAAYLAREGFPAVLFDPAGAAGGIVGSTVPQFRLARTDVERDVERIRRLGVELRLEWKGEIDLEALALEGFTSFVIACGAPVPRRMQIEGSGVERVDALRFLAGAARGRARRPKGAKIVVAGGGYTALDAARVAVRSVEAGGAAGPRVTLAYRRTRREMPADSAEVEAALREGVELRELRLPERLAQGAVVCRVMRLGEPDESGRPRPLPTERTETLACDLLIEAVGETTDRALFGRLGIALAGDGLPLVDPSTLETSRPSVYAAGDAARGPQSVVRAIADGRRVAEAILARAGLRKAHADPLPQTREALRLERRGRLLASFPVEPGKREGLRSMRPDEVERESDRCLSCDVGCLRCVEVCPNRANVALPARREGVFAQQLQILHLDALCNDCGACGFFCPYEEGGLPYRDKPTLFATEKAFAASANPGFLFRGEKILLRAGGREARVSAGRAESAAARGAVEIHGIAGQTLTTELKRMSELAQTVLTEHRYLIDRSAPATTEGS